MDYINTGDLMYNIIDVINTALCYTWNCQESKSKGSSYKEKNFSISLMLYLYEMVDDD